MWLTKNHVRIECEVRLSNFKAHEVYLVIASRPVLYSSMYVIWESITIMCWLNLTLADGGLKKGSISGIYADKNREFWPKVRYFLHKWPLGSDESADDTDFVSHDRDMHDISDTSVKTHRDAARTTCLPNVVQLPS